MCWLFRGETVSYLSHSRAVELHYKESNFMFIPARISSVISTFTREKKKIFILKQEMEKPSWVNGSASGAETVLDSYRLKLLFRGLV